MNSNPFPRAVRPAANAELTEAWPNAEPFGSSTAKIVLLLIVLAGAVARILWLLWRSSTIEREGAYYARIAENLSSGVGWIGIHDYGIELFFPPLFPLAIATLHMVIHNSETSGRIISVLFGSLMTLSMFGIVREMYGARVGYTAALLTALHPILVGVSAAVYSESFYLFLLFTGLFFGIRSARELSYSKAAVSGVLLGLAYLTRSEALLIACLVMSWIVLLGKGTPRAVRVAVSLSASTAIVAIPYICFLYAHTGQIRLEAKSSGNFNYGMLRMRGMSTEQAFTAIDDDLRPVGNAMKSDLEILNSTNFKLTTALRFIKRAARNNLFELTRGLFVQSSGGGIVLVALVAIGLFGSPWGRARFVHEIIWITFIACQLAPLLTLLIFNSRYIIPFIPAFIPWAAKGVDQAALWARGSVPNLLPKIGLASAGTFGATASAGLLLVVTWLGIGSFRDLRPGDPALKIAGVELKRRYAGEAIVLMDTDPVVAFYAGAVLKPFPYSSESTAMRYAAAKKVNVVVVREGSDSEIPYYHQWAIGAIPGSHATLDWSMPSHDFGKILLYRWR